MRKETSFKRSLLAVAIMSIMLFAMTITASAASAVTGLKQTGDGTTWVDVEWNANLGESYRVYISQSKNSGYTRVSSYDTTSNSKSIYDLQKGRTYYVKVQTIKNNSVVAESSPLQVVTRPDYVDSSTIKQTAGTRTAISMTWTSVSGATGYIVKKVGGGSKTTSTNKVTMSVKAGQKYSAEVTAYRKSESGYVAKSSTAYKSSLYSSPAAPINYAEASKGNLDWKPTKSSSVTVRWRSNPNYYYPDGYQLEVYSLSGTKLGSVTCTSTSRTITSAKICKAIKNKGFKTRIRSYKKNDKAVCYSAWSPTKVIIPEASIKLTATSHTSVKVTWPKVANATKYIIYVSRDSGYTDSGHWAKKELSASTTSYSITGLKRFKDFGVFVIPVVKVKGKLYKAAKTWYTYSYVY